MIPGVMPQNHMPVIEETPETVATMVASHSTSILERKNPWTREKVKRENHNLKIAGLLNSFGS